MIKNVHFLEEHKQIWRRINSENVSYYSVRKLSSGLFPKPLKGRTFKAVTCQLFYGCEACIMYRRCKNVQCKCLKAKRSGKEMK